MPDYPNNPVRWVIAAIAALAVVARSCGATGGRVDDPDTTPRRRCDVRRRGGAAHDLDRPEVGGPRDQEDPCRTRPTHQLRRRQDATLPPHVRFALPSAYTILFGLIVIMAIAPGSSRPAATARRNGSPSRHLREVDSTPSRLIVDSLEAPINGLYGIEDPGDGNVDVFNSGSFRRDRRGAVHPRDRSFIGTR